MANSDARLILLKAEDNCLAVVTSLAAGTTLVVRRVIKGSNAGPRIVVGTAAPLLRSKL